MAHPCAAERAREATKVYFEVEGVAVPFLRLPKDPTPAQEAAWREYRDGMATLKGGIRPRTVPVRRAALKWWEYSHHSS